MLDADEPELAYEAQEAGHHVLAHILTMSRQAGLQPLTWTMTETGALTGTTEQDDHTPEQVRTAVKAWARVLDLGPVEQVAWGQGSVLTARRISLVVRAELAPTENHSDAPTA